jgi:hypothetical protein
MWDFQANSENEIVKLHVEGYEAIANLIDEMTDWPTFKSIEYPFEVIDSSNLPDIWKKKFKNWIEQAWQINRTGVGQF